MTEVTGQCHCGKHKYKLLAAPAFQFICYCKSCRQINSGGHLCGVMSDEATFEAATGTNTYVYPGGSGNDIVLHFCGACGTHLYALPTAFDGKVVLRANTLNDFDFAPQQMLHPESAFSWDAVVTGD